MFDKIIGGIANRVEKSATAKRSLMNTLRKTFGSSQLLLLDFRTDDMEKMIEELNIHPADEIKTIKDYYFRENKLLELKIADLQNQIKELTNGQNR